MTNTPLVGDVWEHVVTRLRFSVNAVFSHIALCSKVPIDGTSPYHMPRSGFGTDMKLIERDGKAVSDG